VVAIEQAISDACAALSQRCGGISRWVVAYSGGWDSTALLESLARTRRADSPTLSAIHINHALQAQSAEWAEHCRTYCHERGIELEVITLTEKPCAGESIEAWAREQRYAAFARRLSASDLLLTAHHCDDQAETFLLNALRGAGPDGLQAIAPLRALGNGWLGRPCLELLGDDLRRYCADAGIVALEDPSNESSAFDRNYLRRRVLPVLRERWPSATTTLSRAAHLQRAAVESLAEGARDYLDNTGYQHSNKLARTVLEPLTPQWQAHCLRLWITTRGHRVPSAAQMAEILGSLLEARTDRQPVVEWGTSGLRRYRDYLYLYSTEPLLQGFAPTRWDFATPLDLPGGRLIATPSVGEGLSVAAVAGTITTVRARLGGERCRPLGRAHSQSLKRLLQEAGIPPWQRVQLPLVYVGEALAAVGDLWVCDEYAAGAEQAGWKLQWQWACDDEVGEPPTFNE
jgi:tRNA(Ile)-lysidine synthase